MMAKQQEAGPSLVGAPYRPDALLVHTPRRLRSICTLKQVDQDLKFRPERPHPRLAAFRQ